MSIVSIVQLSMLSFFEVELEAAEHTHDVPLQLADGVALSGAQRAEADHWVLHFFAVLVEFVVHESVVFELLQIDMKEMIIS